MSSANASAITLPPVVPVLPPRLQECASAEPMAAPGYPGRSSRRVSDAELARHIFDPVTPASCALPQRLRQSVWQLRQLYQRACQARSHGATITTPEAAAAALLPYVVGRTTECLLVAPLDARSHCLSVIEVSRGGESGCDVPIPTILRAVLAAPTAVGCCVAHNHPTGNPAPSTADAAVTRTMVAAFRQASLQLNDHLILCPPEQFVSLRRDQPGLFA